MSAQSVQRLGYGLVPFPVGSRDFIFPISSRPAIGLDTGGKAKEAGS
jgi:hypothetical protein